MSKINSEYVKTDQLGWVRDLQSGAIICVDENAKKQHEEEVARQRVKKEELNSMKNELSMLKELVQKLIEDK